MKMIIDVKEDLKPTRDDVLYFDGKQWINAKKCVIFSEQLAEINKLSNKIDELENHIKDCDEKIKYMANALKESL